MLHILLIIGKTLGFLVLGVLGLLLFIVLAFLLVPLRYRGRGSCYGEPEVCVRASWFFHLFSARVTYRKGLKIVFRVLCFPVFKKSVGGEAAKADAEEGLRAAQSGVDDMEEELLGAYCEEEPMVSAQEIKGSEETEAPEETEIPEETEKPEETEAPGKTEAPEETEKPERAKIRAAENRDVRAAKTPEQGQGSNAQEQEPVGEPPKTNFFRRIWLRLRRLFLHIRLTVLRVFKGLKRMEELRDTVREFWEDEENKKTMRLIARQGKKVLCHLRPKRLRGKITFGFDDPYATGQALTGAALLYPFYRDAFQIYPVFDQKILEGEFTMKGRIRLGTLLMAGLRILLNKNFRIQLKRFLKRGGM